MNKLKKLTSDGLVTCLPACLPYCYHTVLFSRGGHFDISKQYIDFIDTHQIIDFLKKSFIDSELSQAFEERYLKPITFL